MAIDEFDVNQERKSRLHAGQTQQIPNLLSHLRGTGHYDMEAILAVK